ncbi:MAG: sensor histidine kinase [Christensenellaceae bacterium]|jgi:two-component system OmpR family sensor kinase
MKYWQKTFLITIILFVCIINLLIFTVLRVSFSTSLAAEREKAFFEQNYIIRGLLEVNTGGSLARKQEMLERSYQYSYYDYYKSKAVHLALRNQKGEIIMRRENGFVMPALDYEDGNQSVVQKTEEDVFLLVEGEIGDLGYSLISMRSVKSMFDKYEHMKIQFVAISMITSIVLAIFLAIILRKLNDPLIQLSKTTKVIAAGEYTARITERGSGEIKELAEQFNRMAAQIETQIEYHKEMAENRQRFIDDLAHEMRTPLSAISGYAQLLLVAVNTEEERQKMLGYIDIESKRLLDISEKLLLLAEKQTYSIQKTPVFIRDLMEEIKNVFHMQIAQSQITFINQIDQTLIWEIDETLLYILLSNLLQNAIRACKQNGIVKVMNADNTIMICDDGVGIEKEDLSKITEPFYRTDTSRARRYGGIGLGLALCQKIATQLHIEMKFSSEVGKGTRVSLELLQLSDNTERSSV